MSRKRGIKALLHDSTNLPVCEGSSRRSCAAGANSLAPRPSKQQHSSEHTQRLCAGIASQNIATLSARKAPRGVSAQPEQAQPPGSLKQVLKSRPEILRHAHDKIGGYIARNTTFKLQKAMALNVFSVAMSEGSGILEACDLASKYSFFSAKTIRSWAEALFLHFFGSISNIDDVDDKVLEDELASSRGRHPKWDSLLHDEEFKLKATEYMREHGYVKGAPNLTLADFVRWVSEVWDVKICMETARVWLHSMGFTYRQFSKGIYFDGHEREDVVDDRSKYLSRMASLEDRMITSPDQLTTVQPAAPCF